MNDLKKWIRIRKELYLQVERQVRYRLGEDTPELAKYRDYYDMEFQRKWVAATKEELWSQLERSQVLMLGDFHALHQSQKAQLRVLRHIPRTRKQILAVEFFEASDQDKIDRFLAGSLTEREFLRAIQWQSRWGFPWEHYRPLMRWAQKHKISVFGLNKTYKKRTATTLKSRDEFAGKRISDIVRQNPDHLLIVIYGDLHLAQEHIPYEIEKNMGIAFMKKVLRVFQNSERIYFQLLNKDIEATTDLVRLKQNVYCLMSVPPWVKWQNYLMYLEKTYDMELGDEDEDEGVLDYTDHIGSYVKVISEELGLKISTANLSVYTAADDTFWEQLRAQYGSAQLLWLETMIAEGMSFYLPEIKAAFLGRGTVNHAAALAMRYIHAEAGAATRVLNPTPDDFLGLIWVECIAYFGSKIINHKRKSDTLADIKSSLSSRGSEGFVKEAMQLALSQKMQELMVINGGKVVRSPMKVRKKWSYLLAAELLGGMMGERMYSGYSKKRLAPALIVNMIKKPFDVDAFRIAYYELAEVIESLPAPFYSKREKL